MSRNYNKGGSVYETTQSDIQANKKNENIIYDPIYYNLSLNRGLGPSVVTASFTEINNSPILFNSGDWYLSLMRTSIPSGNIPRYLFPIKTGSTQGNINLAYNFFAFRYVTGVDVNGNYTFTDLPNINDYTLNVSFVSELINPYPKGTNKSFALPYPPNEYPLESLAPKGQQDLSGQYYWIYNIESIVNMFNTTLRILWVTYITAWNSAFPSNQFPTHIQPYYTYDNVSGLWSFNAESIRFNQTQATSTFVPFIGVFCDSLTASNTMCPNRFNPKAITDANGNTPTYLLQVNYYYENTKQFTINSSISTYPPLPEPQPPILPVVFTFIQNTADQSSISTLAAFQKIIFEISGDILIKNNEIESASSNFQLTNISQISTQKPTIAMLVDIEIDKEQWAKNSSFIQFQASSIEQIRLISLSERSVIQNFVLNIYWLDTYGNRYPLELPSVGNPLTIKLAFFNKQFKH